MDKTFAEKLKQIKNGAGLTQQDVADILKVSKRTVEEWERGKSKPPEYVQRFVLNELEGGARLKSPSLQRLQSDLEDCRAEVKAFKAEARNILDHTPRDTAKGLVRYQRIESIWTFLNYAQESITEAIGYIGTADDYGAEHKKKYTEGEK